MRDFTTRPYSLDEQRVVAYLKEIMPEIGAGDDPIGFLLASHATLADRAREFMKAYQSIIDGQSNDS